MALAMATAAAIAAKAAAATAWVSAMAAPLVPAAIVAGTGTAIYTSVKTGREAEKARSEAAAYKQQELEFMEKQAGEYYQLSAKQMELQTQAASIKTLSNLIETSRTPAPQVFTLPPARKYSAVQQFNQAVDRIVRG